MASWDECLTAGIKVPKGSPVPVRKEIRDLSDIEMYLYLEGMAKFQKQDIDNPNSYFQIAGIHGRPYQIWPNKDWNKDIPARKWSNSQNDSGGFCAHSSILFLTWHRPYLSLYEAALYGHVNDIASNIDSSTSNKQAYMDAAKKFRMPYWDWARIEDVSSVAPDAASDSKKLPLGPASTASVNPDWNPLYAFPFDDAVTQDITRLDINDKKYTTTVRYPPSKDKPNRNPDSSFKGALDDFADNPEKYYPFKPGKNLTERIVYILQSYLRFGPMSNNRYLPKNTGDKADNPEIWGSMEDVHNALHVVSGGGGHMGSVPVAAFDPIFWLHHTNIDRLYTMWQALHETGKDDQTWVTDQAAVNGTIIIAPNTVEKASDPLYPFKDANGAWYNSNGVKRTEIFGYTYPETKGLTYPTNDAARARLKKTIDAYYMPPASMIQASINGDETAGEILVPRADLLVKLATQDATTALQSLALVLPDMPSIQDMLQQSLQPGKPFLKDLAPDNKYLEWLVNIKAEKHSLGGNFAVHIFLGTVDQEDPSLWPASPYYIGAFVPLGQDTNTGCAKCQDDQQDHMEITGQIPLTIALMERYLATMVAGLDVNSVVPYLQENLHWRVVAGDSVLDDRSQVNGLTVFVVSNEVTLSGSDSRFPTYAPDVTIHPEVTTNRNGTGRGDGTGLVAGEQ